MILVDVDLWIPELVCLWRTEVVSSHNGDARLRSELEDVQLSAAQALPRPRVYLVFLSLFF